MSGWLDRKISPMLATSGRPFDSPRHLFELKWDGIRALAFFGRGKVRLQGRKLTDSTDRYPEIARALRQLPGEAVLDGEIVVLDDDKPDFERVLVREQARDPGKVAFLARRHPALYMIFDLLYLNGRELVEEPLRHRRELLSRLLTDRPPSPLIESSYIVELGVPYYEGAVERGLEGIMAKELESPYLPGKRTGYWTKIKAQRTMDCVVLGTVLEGGTRRVRSLVLGAYRGPSLVWMGNVGSGLDFKTLDALRRELGPLTGDPPASFDIPIPGEVRWLKPALVARVNYLETTREGRLRAPVFIGFVDQPPKTCRAPESRR